MVEDPLLTTEEYDALSKQLSIDWTFNMFGNVSLQAVQLYCRELGLTGFKTGVVEDALHRHPKRRQNQQVVRTPSKTIISYLPTIVVDSAVNQNQILDILFKEFISELKKNTLISFFVNGAEVVQQEDGQDFWIESLASPAKTRDEVKESLGITFEISNEDVHRLGLEHDSNKLQELGESQYQKWFNGRNVDKKSNFLLGTHSTNSGIPISQQPEEDGPFKFTGKPDNLSTIRPLFIEFKGMTGQKPSKNLRDWHFEVLDQAIRRAYAMSCVQQYFANIGVFAVCFDRIWLVWYEKKLEPKELKLKETINVINIDPDDFSYIWAILTKQALENRNVMFMNNNDHYYLINFLNHIHPKIAHYCRTRFVKKSMNSVYAVTLPQVLAPNTTTMCLSNNEKHFALKVIPSQSEFEQEVACIARINQYIKDNRMLEIEFANFYAVGSKSWNCDYVSYNNILVNLATIRSELSFFFSSSLEENFQNLKVDDTSQPKPWWLYEPTPDIPIEGGGVIVMLCGDLKHKITPITVKPMIRSVKSWLNLYHRARVVHRDIRLSNIVKFDYPSRYQYIYGLSGKLVSDSYLQWQLIDFNLGHCLENSEDNVSTIIHKDSTPWMSAVWSIQNKIMKNGINSQIELPWGFAEDSDMLTEMILTFVNERET